MSDPNGSCVTLPIIRNLLAHQTILEHLLLLLQGELAEHNLEQDGTYRYQYHVTLQFNTLHGPGHEQLLMTWQCYICRSIYRLARPFNNQLDDIYHQL